MDAVQQANSGHPGRADGDWRRWPTRCGSISCASIPKIRSGPTATASCCPTATPRCCSIRCCILRREGGQSAIRALGELAVTLDDIKRFRQLDSKCPGHPEYRWTSGVETTTGPLGQGVGNSVGMAIAALDGEAFQPARLRHVRLRRLRAVRRRRHDGGRQQRGRVAGRHLMLGNLCWIYDNNRITIEGHTDLAFSEDVAARFIGLWLERGRGSRRQRSGDAGSAR
jgi:transketolase